MLAFLLWALGCGSPLVEVCDNGVDDDGNGRVDCDQRSCARSCDADGDGHRAIARGGRDCDDGDPAVFPGAPEVCNGIDDDCDGLADDADVRDGPTDPVTLWLDRDGDGFGDSDAPLLRCAVGPGVAAVGGDCSDRDPDVYPGRAEVCDGLDTDCDGVVPADEVDADGDGAPACRDCDDSDALRSPDFAEVCDGRDSDCDGIVPPDEVDGDGDGDPVCSDCDDADPARSHLAQERCSGLDDDCDGWVDEADDSVNPYTCGYCPAPDPVAARELVPYFWETWNPCVLDPTTQVLCSTDPKFPDTHTEGERLHRVGWRTDEGQWRDELLLFLPPGPGNQNYLIRYWAAYAGFRVVSLGFPNEDVLTTLCSNPDADQCWIDARTETLYGTDLSPLIDVPPQDSIEGRLQTLLAHLVVEHPDMGFERHLAPDGSILWDQIVVMGWSFGGAEGAFLAKHEAVRAAIMLSSPKDHTVEPTVDPVSWPGMPGATPGCALFSSWHIEEPYSVPPEDLLNRAWDAMDMPSQTSDLDLQPGTPPPGTHRISQSFPVDQMRPGCDAHGSVGNDACMRDEQHPAYLYLMCTAADTDPETCDVL